MAGSNPRREPLGPPLVRPLCPHWCAVGCPPARAGRLAPRPTPIALAGRSLPSRHRPVCLVGPWLHQCASPYPQTPR
eukprot:3816667-Pleurochrysis_carterae.AAC.1